MVILRGPYLCMDMDFKTGETQQKQENTNPNTHTQHPPLSSPMASRSFLLPLRRIRCKNSETRSGSRLEMLSLNHHFHRFFSYGGGAFGQEVTQEEEPSSSSPAQPPRSFSSSFEGNGDGDDLRSRIFRLRLPKRSVANVIQRWVSEGNSVSAPLLRDVSRELRNSQRYKHALEISEWMVTHDEFELSDSDYATRIDLMNKVFGIDAAERYFEGLPVTAKTTETYTALLHSYAGAKLIEKAEHLYERIKESNLPFSAITYNEMMTLYMSAGQVEKVASVIDELKHQKVAPDIFTYNLWISSCAAALDIDGVRKILDEMRLNSGSNNDWLRYIDIANIYVTAGNLVNSESSPIVLVENGITQREWITYDFLIILYAGQQNKDRIDQIWKSLRLTKQKMTSRNYICILSSYLRLGHLKEVAEVIDQWKQSTTTTDFDVSTFGRIIDAFSGAGLTEIANSFHMLLIQKNCDPASLGSQQR